MEAIPNTASQWILGRNVVAAWNGYILKSNISFSIHYLVMEMVTLFNHNLLCLLLSLSYLFNIFPVTSRHSQHRKLGNINIDLRLKRLGIFP